MVLFLWGLSLFFFIQIYSHTYELIRFFGFIKTDVWRRFISLNYCWFATFSQSISTFWGRFDSFLCLIKLIIRFSWWRRLYWPFFISHEFSCILLKRFNLEFIFDHGMVLLNLYVLEIGCLISFLFLFVGFGFDGLKQILIIAMELQIISIFIKCLCIIEMANDDRTRPMGLNQCLHFVLHFTTR